MDEERLVFAVASSFGDDLPEDDGLIVGTILDRLYPNTMSPEVLADLAPRLFAALAKFRASESLQPM